MIERSLSTIVVLATPRSGSSWLGSMLRDSGALGVCREWLTGLVYPTFQHQVALPAPGPNRCSALRDAIAARASSANGVAAIKIVTSTLDALPPLLAQWDVGDGRSDRWIGDLFPGAVIVVLRRLDEIGQALSWWRAKETGQFTRPAKGDGAWPEYDFASLQAALREIRQHSSRLTVTARALTARAGLRLLELNYEDLERAPLATIRAIAALAGVDLPPDWSPTSEISVQRDAVTESLRARFLHDLSIAHPAETNATPDATRSADPPMVPDTDEGALALGHRRFVGGEGGHWNAIGRLQFDYLIRAGLRPDHVLLDVACGSLRGGVHFIPYLDPGNYIGFDRLASLIILGVAEELGVERFREKRPHFIINDRLDLSELPLPPDFALAQSLFTHLSDGDIARVFTALTACSKPATRFFASFFPRLPGDPDNPPDSHARRVFRQTPDALRTIAASQGWTMNLIGEWGHPRGQHIAEFRRQIPSVSR